MEIVCECVCTFICWKFRRIASPPGWWYRPYISTGMFGSWYRPYGWPCCGLYICSNCCSSCDGGGGRCGAMWWWCMLAFFIESLQYLLGGCNLYQWDQHEYITGNSRSTIWMDSSVWSDRRIVQLQLQSCHWWWQSADRPVAHPSTDMRHESYLIWRRNTTAISRDLLLLLLRRLLLLLLLLVIHIWRWCWIWHIFIVRRIHIASILLIVFVRYIVYKIVFVIIRYFVETIILLLRHFIFPCTHTTTGILSLAYACTIVHAHTCAYM